VLVHNARVQEIANDLCDFASMRIQCEVAGVEEAHVSAWNVTLNASTPAGTKNGSFLPYTAKNGGWCVRKYF
jgi:hypothetical protein